MPAIDSRNVRLEKRDKEILLDLIESRVLTLDQIRTLFFPDTKDMAKKRVQRLKAGGYLSERPRRIGEPSILHLTWKGYTALVDGDDLKENSDLTAKTFASRMKVSASTLTHELMIGDVRTSFTLAMRESKRFELRDFDVWPRRYDFTVNRGHGRVPVKPDGYLSFFERVMEEDGDYDFFVEVDTGSETLDRVVEKCLNYREYYRSGGYAILCGGKRDEVKEYPFRVLVVCKSEERRNNLAERLLEVNPPFSTMILITTQAECVRDPLGDIWLTAAGYKNVVVASAQLCSIIEG